MEQLTQTETIPLYSVQPREAKRLDTHEVGRDEVPANRPRAIKKNFRDLGQLVKGSVTWAVFSSFLPVAGRDEKWREVPISQYLAPSLVLWYCWKNYYFFYHELFYTTPDLFSTDIKQLSQTRKRIFFTRHSRAHWKSFNCIWNGKGIKFLFHTKPLNKVENLTIRYEHDQDHQNHKWTKSV